MKNAVIIKSFPNGLTIFLDSEIPFSQLLEEIGMKFSESANFFKDASMVLSFEGRELSEQEERQIVDMITANSRLNIVCIMGKDKETDRNFLRALQQFSFHQECSKTQGSSIRGRLRTVRFWRRRTVLSCWATCIPAPASYPARILWCWADSMDRLTPAEMARRVIL